MSTSTTNKQTQHQAGRKRGIDVVLSVVLALTGFLVLASLLPIRLLTRLDPAALRVEVPIPAEMLSGGVAPLSAGSWLDLYARVPNAQGTPQPYTLDNVSVASLPATDSVLLAVPPEMAPTLQAVLLVEDARFSYRLLPGTPTAIPTPGQAPADTPRPEPSAIPGAGRSYLSLGTDRLDLSASWLATGRAQILVIEKLQLPPLAVQGETNLVGAAQPVHDVVTYTVSVVAFLDEDGVQHDVYDEETDQVLIQLAADQWADLARSLAGAASIWLIHLAEE